MFIGLLRISGLGILSAILALAVVTRFVRRRLMPGRACVAGAVMGFCGWVAFAVSPGSSWGIRNPSFAVTAWLDWVAFAPLIVPLLAGLLGWLGTASRWRWAFLGAGVALGVLPYLAAIIEFERGH
jgi:hypothetical protein